VVLEAREILRSKRFLNVDEVVDLLVLRDSALIKRQGNVSTCSRVEQSCEEIDEAGEMKEKLTAILGAK